MATIEHGTHRSTRRPPGPRAAAALGSLFDPRANSLNWLRLLLAATVAVVHASAIAYGHQPHLGATEVGSLAVDAFFVLSGFLVVRSLLRLDSVGRYAWHRALRILPGFWVCLLLTVLVVAPVLALLEGADGLAVPAGAQTYLGNALLYMRDFAVGGLPAGTATPGVVNGALWTLFYEACCYALVAVLGALGLLRPGRRRVVVALTIGLGLALLARDLGLDLPAELFLRFFFVFLLGALGWLYADRLPVTGVLTVGALVLFGVSLAAATDYRPLGGVAFAYLCLVAVVRTPWLRRGPRSDLSYGVYVYHWPVETILVTAGATALTQVGYTALAVLVTAGLAAVSWRVVERPALGLKDLRRR